MKTVTIYLAFTEKCGEPSTIMFDSNGYFGINDLRTVFWTEEEESGKIFWLKAYGSGIEKIVDISWKKELESGLPKPKPCPDEHQPDLFVLHIPAPEKLVFPLGKDGKKTTLTEHYKIKYKTNNGKEVVIDPPIDIKPPQP